jgi:hypothetical protein
MLQSWMRLFALHQVRYVSHAELLFQADDAAGFIAVHCQQVRILDC